ncbi:MAG: AAA family ATPase [Candidatus Magasanikbacteria bacterium]|jgi:DNA helicase IV|nr:AAA family ATPase [Candidatus Magasanikbacteria bacterium]
MNQAQKDTLFAAAAKHLQEKVDSITDRFTKLSVQNIQMAEDLPKLNEDNKIVQHKLLEHGKARQNELEVMIESPYFMHCQVDFGSGEHDNMYFGKFSSVDHNIYSWITPASAIRFEKPGSVSYERPNGDRRTGNLQKKDQYMITEATIRFLSSESEQEGRQLIYQEYFSNQKKGFILPEIVAQMEKAQDEVIRANHRGPLVISGPAGSGKTTLALHRVAYLTQSPDVSDKFPPTSILVFVQDEGTREYFSHLLPELGIKGVKITTFAQWAMRVLELDSKLVYRVGKSQVQKDNIEFAKREALKQIRNFAWHKKPYEALRQVYATAGQEVLDALTDQEQLHQLDRFDITVLLILQKKHEGALTIMQEYYKTQKDGSAVKKMGRFAMKYSLLIFDEFQNYLPEQIALAKSVLDPEHNAVMYVGDMAQQTQIGTIREWSEAREDVKEDRVVALQKVYRNTKAIMRYIEDAGYTVSIPEQMREGVPVQEFVLEEVAAQVSKVQQIIDESTGRIGVLALTEDIANIYKLLLNAGEHVHIMSIHEAQGVEFEAVCLVGVTHELLSNFGSEYSEEMREEKKRTVKDMLYVALTRAMNELYVVGPHALKNTYIDSK